jgi:hypothetical protein
MEVSRLASTYDYRLHQAYAEALIDFLSSVSERASPRFVFIGFEELMPYLPDLIAKKHPDTVYLRPEDSGKVLDAFEGRKHSSNRIIIHLSHREIGRFASLVTSFRVVDDSLGQAIESDLLRMSPLRKDVYTPFDVSNWIIGNLPKLGEHIMGSPRSWLEGAQCVLQGLEENAEKFASLKSFLHPKNILHSVLLLENERFVSVGSFMRSLHVESCTDLEKVELKKDVDVEEAYDCLELDARMRRLYASCDTSFRSRLASLGLFLLEFMLVKCAREEGAKGKFRRILRSLVSRVGTRRVYGSIGSSTQVLRSSAISGLPDKFIFVIRRRVDSGTEDVLKILHEGALQDLCDCWPRCDRVFSGMWSMDSFELSYSPTTSLAIAVSFPHPLLLDAYKLGTGRSLSAEIAELLG